MKGKLCGVCVTFLWFQTCLALSDKILVQVGNKASLPCNPSPSGDVEWFQEKRLVISYKNGRKTFPSRATVSDTKRYSFPFPETKELVVMDVRTSDSGTYTCKAQTAVTRTVELFVFEVSVFPSANLLPSEDLVLDLTPSSAPGLQVSWEKNGIVMSNSPKLEEKNMQLDGNYLCRITMDAGKELRISKQVRVSGFKEVPSIIYVPNKSPVTIPWIFNFTIRKNPMSSEVHVEEGSISYSSQILNQLNITGGAASWPERRDAKEASQDPKDLSVHLPNPKRGKYQMEILLRIEDRRKKLTSEVCVAGLTVSDSESDVSMDTKVPLHCRINCIESNKKLCWHQIHTNIEKCGKEGQDSLNEEITAGNEDDTWTCSVTDGKQRLISANVTITVQLAFLNLSNALFWVTVGVGIFIFLLIVTIITLVIARNRRMRRARRRAWLLENLHQKRKCECKGFAPQRLRDAI